MPPASAPGQSFEWLRLACGDRGRATCGSGASTVIWDQVIALGGKSFAAEFDAFFSVSDPASTTIPAPRANATARSSTVHLEVRTAIDAALSDPVRQF